MKLTKGTIIRQIRVNEKPNFENTTANSVLDYEVTRVNKNSYTVKCVEGYMKGSGCKILKEAIGKTYTDVYGTKTTYMVIE